MKIKRVYMIQSGKYDENKIKIDFKIGSEMEIQMGKYSMEYILQ